MTRFSMGADQPDFCGGAEPKPDGEWVKYDDAEREIAALRARLAEALAKRDELWDRTETLTRERDAVTIDRDAHRDRSAAQEETIRLLRARLAEVERENAECCASDLRTMLERDSARKERDALLSESVKTAQEATRLRSERDDARRVAKRLAQGGVLLGDGEDAFEEYRKARATALAYEVGP